MRNSRPPLRASAPVVKPVERVVAVEDAGPLRGGPGELDRALDGLGARVGEDDPLDSGVRAGHQLLGQDAREERTVHLHEVREVGVEGVVQRLDDGRVPPAEGEDAEAGQKVQVSVPFVVDEVTTLALDVEAVELQGSQHPGQLRVHVLGVEGEVLALTLVQHLLQIKRHAVGSRGRAPGGRDRLVVAPVVLANRTPARPPPRFAAKIPRRRKPGSQATRKGHRVTTTAPNILLVMSDQHRADMMGCAGDPSVLTPSLDALAAEGVRFSRVSCQGPLCMPSRASFMTERYVRDHGVFTNWAEIPEDSPTYARALREAGYHTSLLGKAHLYLDEKLSVSHIDDMAGRLEALGFAEVFETGDKFVSKIPSRYTDYPGGASTSWRHTRSTSPTAATRARTKTARTRRSACPCGTRHRCRCPWRPTSTPGTASRPCNWIERYDRARAVLPLRRLPGAPRPLGRTGGSRAALPGRRHLDAALDPASHRRGHGSLRRAPELVPLGLRLRDDDRGRHPWHAPLLRGGHLGHRPRRGRHDRRARGQRAAGQHVDRLHQRPRGDGGQPRAHVQVRPLRAGGTRPADRPPAGRLPVPGCRLAGGAARRAGHTARDRRRGRHPRQRGTVAAFDHRWWIRRTPHADGE